MLGQARAEQARECLFALQNMTGAGNLSRISRRPRCDIFLLSWKHITFLVRAMTSAGNPSGRRSKLPAVESAHSPPVTYRVHDMTLHMCIEQLPADSITRCSACVLPEFGGPVEPGSPLEPGTAPTPQPFRPGGLHPCRLRPAEFPGSREGGLFAQFGFLRTRINPRVLGLPRDRVTDFANACSSHEDHVMSSLSNRP
jgi:hypothetical protein